MAQFKITGLLLNEDTDEHEESEKVIEAESYETAYDYAYNYFDKAVYDVTEV